MEELRMKNFFEKLTTGEKAVMHAVLVSAAGNGYDFGFTDEVIFQVSDEFNALQAGARISTLRQKGLIEVHSLKVNNRTLKQITLREDLKEACYDGDAIYAQLTP
jgi:hypothetical protein